MKSEAMAAGTDENLSAGEPTTPITTGQDRRATDRRGGGTDRRNGLDRRRGPGRRRSDVRRQAEEGEMSDELLEFVLALDEYKRLNNRPFPSWSEVFEVIQYLGYRKVAERCEHVDRISLDDDSTGPTSASALDSDT